MKKLQDPRLMSREFFLILCGLFDFPEFITIYLNLLPFIILFFWILLEFLKLKSIFRNILFYF